MNLPRIQFELRIGYGWPNHKEAIQICTRAWDFTFMLIGIERSGVCLRYNGLLRGVGVTQSETRIREVVQPICQNRTP